MSYKTNSARHRARDRVSPDHLPACPRCGDLCAYDSVVCVECGCELFPIPAREKVA